MDLDLGEKKTKLILLVFLVVGIVLLSLGPVLGTALDKTMVAQEEGSELNTNSATDLDEAYSQEFTLGKNEKAIIEFSVFYPNSTVVLKIVGKGETQSQTGPVYSPSAMSGETFIHSTFERGQIPGSATDVSSVTATNDDYYYIEFMGSADGQGNLQSIPGDYVVVVYTSTANETQFDITIQTDGPADAGDVINTIFTIAGWGLIIAFLAVVSFSVYKEATEVKA